MLELSLPKYIRRLPSLEMLDWNFMQKAVSESDSAIHLSDIFLASHFTTLVSTFFLHTYFDSLLCRTGDVSDCAYFLYLTSWAVVPFQGQGLEREKIEEINPCVICRKAREEVDQVQKFT